MIYSEREQKEFKKFFEDDLGRYRGKYILYSLQYKITLVTEERFGGGGMRIEIPLHPSILENMTDLSEDDIMKRKSKSLPIQYRIEYSDYITLFRFKPYKTDENYGFKGENGYKYSVNDNLLLEKYRSVKSLKSLREGTYFRTYYDTLMFRKYLIDFLPIKSFNYFSNYAELSTDIIQKGNALIFVIYPKKPEDFNRVY